MPYRLGSGPAYPYGPAARFTLTGIQPPAGSYLAPSDQLSLSVLSPNAPISFNLSLRFLDLTGNVQPLLTEVTAPATGATPFVLPIQTSEGFLLSATAFGASVKRGQCWVQFVILRQKAADLTVIGDVILQGYVSQTDIVNYPGTQEKSSIDGRGCLREFIVPAAAPGTPLAFSVPAATRWRLVSVGCTITFTTGGTTSGVRILDGSSNRIADIGTGTPINGSPTIASWFYGGASFGGSLFALQGPLPGHLYLLAGWSVNVLTLQNFDPATVFGPAQVIVEEWAELQ